jgi:hypothetical protein
MGLILPGWPVTNPSRPYNPDTNYNAGKPMVRSPSGIPWYGRAGCLPYIPRLGNYYAVIRAPANTARLTEIIRYDADPASAVSWEMLSGSAPYGANGRETPVMIGDGVLVAADAISLTNGYQWIRPNKTLDPIESAAYIAETSKAIYYIDDDNCEKTADCTVITGAASGATWTVQGAATWTVAKDPSNDASQFALWLNGTRLIAVRNMYDDSAAAYDLEMLTSDDDGATWTSRHHRTTSVNIRAMKMARISSTNLLVVTAENPTGTGSGNELFITYESSDNGTNWTRTARFSVGFASGTTSFDRFIRLASGTYLICPSGSGYGMGQNKAVARSTDSGVTWTAVYTVVTGFIGGHFHEYSFEVDSAVRKDDNSIVNIYSDDDGLTWSESATGYSNATGQPDFFAGILA